MRHDVTKVATRSVKFSMDAQCFNVRSKMEAPWTFDTRKIPPPPPKNKRKQREVLDGFQGCEEDDPDDGGKVWILDLFLCFKVSDPPKHIKTSRYFAVQMCEVVAG